jgi:hypothetical protein
MRYRSPHFTNSFSPRLRLTASLSNSLTLFPVLHRLVYWPLENPQIALKRRKPIHYYI